MTVVIVSGSFGAAGGLALIGVGFYFLYKHRLSFDARLKRSISARPEVQQVLAERKAAREAEYEQARLVRASKAAEVVNVVDRVAGNQVAPTPQEPPAEAEIAPAPAPAQLELSPDEEEQEEPAA